MLRVSAGCVTLQALAAWVKLVVSQAARKYLICASCIGPKSFLLSQHDNMVRAVIDKGFGGSGAELSAFAVVCRPEVTASQSRSARLCRRRPAKAEEWACSSVISRRFSARRWPI